MNRGTLITLVLLAALGCKNESTSTTTPATAAATLPTASATPSASAVASASPQPSDVPWKAGACKTADDCSMKEPPGNDAIWVCDNGMCVRRSTHVH